MPAAAILSLAGPVLAGRERALLREADPWGVILFRRNVTDPAQLAALTAEVRAALGRDCPILVDQEGGQVQRLRPPHWQLWRPPLEEATRAGAAAGRVLYLRAALIAAELRACGIDTDCIPCADVARPATHPFLRDRCLGFEPETVAHLARTTADGLLAGGCLPVLKHLPGHGGAQADSHHALPVVPDGRAQLAARDFVPFRHLADLPLGMTAHVVYPALDPSAPATHSPAVIRLIRYEIGFDGLLMTDDLSMQALAGRLADRAAAAFAAGCDLALYCHGIEGEAAEVLSVTPALTGAALARAEAALARRPAAASIDIAAARAEFSALTGG